MPLDRAALQGTWYVVSLVVDGRPTQIDAFQGSRIVINGKRFAALGMGATYEGTIELDPKKTPKRLDLVFSVGHAAGTRNLGIYKLARGRWTICLATRGSERPSRFVSKPGSGIALETLARDVGVHRPSKTGVHPRDLVASPKKCADVEPAEASSSPTVLEGEWAMVAGVLNGAALSEDMVTWCKRVTRGDVTSVVAGPQVMLRARFSLDLSRKPGTVDYMNLEGTHLGKSQLGIFDLSGETLKICMAAPGRSRPSEFLSKPRDGRSYTTWRLIKR